MQPMRVGAIAPGQSLPTAGPKGLGQQVAVGAGAYTSITNVYGPAQAAPGEQISIQAVVKNLASYAIYIAVTGRYNGSDIAFTPDYINVGAGSSYSFNVSFAMPDKNITLDIWSWYWTGTTWYQDDHKAVSISKISKWIALASTSLPVKKTLVGAWVPLASTSIAVKLALVGGWLPLAAASLRVVVGVVVGKDIFKSLAVDFKRKMPEEFKKTT